MEQKVHRIDCSFLRPIPDPHKALSAGKERLMLAFRSLRGYRYYYCQDHGAVCAYLFLKHNYLGYYAFMKRDDLLINPYKTLPPYRRQGYAAALLHAAVADARRNGQTLYAVVTKDNTASQSALLKAGFQKLGFVEHRSRRFAGSRMVFAAQPTDLLLFGYGDNKHGTLLGEG